MHTDQITSNKSNRRRTAERRKTKLFITFYDSTFDIPNKLVWHNILSSDEYGEQKSLAVIQFGNAQAQVT